MAQGHAMISTVTAAAKPRTSGAVPASAHHATNVTTASAITMGTNTALIRSASA